MTFSPLVFDALSMFRSFMVNPLVNGLILGLLVIGVFLSFRVLNIADLSVEGILPMLTILTAILINNNLNPWLVILICACIGAVAGALNALLTIYLKTPPLLSGIIVMALCFGVAILLNSLEVEKVNFDPTQHLTAFNWLKSLLNNGTTNEVWRFYASYLSYIIVGFVILALVWAALYFFFATELGMSIRAAGKNPTMAEANGISVSKMQIIALSLSGALIGVASSLYGQQKGFGNSHDGQGMIVIALSSLFLGEMIVGTRSFKRSLLSCVVGSLVYWYVIQALMLLDKTGYMTELYRAILLVLIIGLQFLLATIKKKFPKKPKGIEEGDGESVPETPQESMKEAFMRLCFGRRNNA